MGKLHQGGLRSGPVSSDVSQKSILSVKEAAEYLGVSSKTILEEIHKGKIPAVKIGRAWRIHRELLDELTKGLSVDDAAGYLGIPPEAVLEKIQKGEIPAVQVGGEWRINPELLDDLKDRWTDELLFEVARMHYKGLTPAEIGARIGKSAATIRKMLKEAEKRGLLNEDRLARGGAMNH